MRAWCASVWRKNKLAFTNPARWRHQFTPRRIALFILNFLWTAVLWVVLVTKIAYEGFGTYITYFTNWSWAFQAIFGIIYLFSYLDNPCKRTLETWLLYAFWWIVFAQVFIVFVLVIWVIEDSATLVTKEMKIGGGEYSDGTVLNIEALVHKWPAIIAILNLFLLWTDIADVLIYTFADVVFMGENLCHHESFVYRIRKEPGWLYIAFTTVVSAIPIVVYFNAFDFRDVYELEDFPIYAGVILVFVIVIFAVFVPLIYQFMLTIPNTTVPKNERRFVQKKTPGEREQIYHIHLPQ